MNPKSANSKIIGTKGKTGECNFCGKKFIIGNPKYHFRRKYCSAKCIKKRWERDNQKFLKEKALLWRRKNGMLPAGKSSGEEKIYNKLVKIFHNYTIIRRTKKIIKNPFSSHWLELDFYIPDLKLAIEVDGSVHRVECYGKNRLNKQIERDNIKEIECRKLGITLIRVPYGKDIDIYGELAILDVKDLIKILENIKNNYELQKKRKCRRK